MSIDWGSVNWGYVMLLSGFTLIAALIANFITFGRRFVRAILTALLFAAVFVFATYYPHGKLYHVEIGAKQRAFCMRSLYPLPYMNTYRVRTRVHVRV